MTKPILAATLSCQSTKLTEQEKVIFSKTNPVGVTLFARNIETPSQTKELIKEIKETIGRENILIALDQEGGRVRRLKEPYFRSYASASQLGSLPISDATKAITLHSELIAFDMHQLGFNVNFAPVLDIAYPKTSEALKSRCFSNDITKIISFGQTMITTYLNCGILPCIKHLPGHGLATTDPHLNLPIIDIPKFQIEEQLEPFKQCNKAPLGMTAHILLPSIDNINPLTQSPIGIQKLIRESANFDGFLISDAIDMKALQGSISQKAQKSIDAGCDCVCYCMGNIEELEELAQYCPKLSDVSKERLDKAVKFLHNKHNFDDIEHKANEYSNLIGKTTAYNESYDATEVLHKLQEGKV